jgi:tetratricopeptide (TPR) repeat protein
MKKIIYIIFPLLSFLSCNDFLDVSPQSNYTVDEGYKNQADFERAIAAVYGQQQVLYNSNSCWFMQINFRSDDARNANNISRFVDSPNEGAWSTAWRAFWSIINRSNLILDHIDNATFTDEAVRDHIKGEAYIMRAYAYWSLGWQWGGVPLVTKTTPLPELRKIKRSTQEETFALAESDYKNAYALLPENWSSNNIGRATKYAAAGMLGRLYMFQSNYDSATVYLEKVIAKEPALYKMESAYGDCFIDSKDNGKERVWEVQFIGGQLGEGSSFISGFIPEKLTIPNDRYKAPFSGYSGNMRASEDLWAAYEESPKVDLRKDLSVITYVKISGIYDMQSKLVHKYCKYDYTPKEKNDWANNLPILRYTDVKMMYAEALNQLSYVADINSVPFKILNEVRARAGLDPLTPTELPDKDAFQEAIIQERRVEFAFEGLRWCDLIRWGIAVDTMNEHFKHADEGSGRYSVKDYQILLPIPFAEMSAYNDKSVMWQNDGY